MTSQAVPESTPGQHAARSILLGIPPRMFQQARGQLAGGTLVRASHPQFGNLRASSGDRVYLCAFADGKLALIGRLLLDPGRAGDAAQGSIGGRAPFSVCRADRIVPHDIARELRSTSGDALRFARVANYELHPGALLKPLELEPESAEALDSLLTETPSPTQVALTAGGVERPLLARRSRSRSDALVERDRAILELAGTGAAYSEIAQRFEISRQRVSQIIRAAEQVPEIGGTAVTHLSSAELLAAHAALVEARQSAGTRGERQGATRRIRSVEKALRERKVEFESAALERRATRSTPMPSTPEELLAAHGAWVKARASAQTGGERQGASRRIRNIEAALRERGVEFEPAAFDGRPQRATPRTSTPEDLLAAHAAQIEARASADTPGTRAGATKRIRNIEAALRERSVEFEPAAMERQPRSSMREPSTPEELLAAHAAQIDVRASANTRGARAGATKRIRNIEAALRYRAVEFEPAAFGRQPRRSTPMPSAPDELRASHAAWVEARASAQTGGERQGASRRIRNIEAALRERGVEFEPAKLGRPPRRSTPGPSTPEELLAVHAALVEARQSAGTRGERQGATRRIRNVETALRERNVEFEPAALERRAARSPPMPSTPEELLAAHAAWAEARASAQTGGERQGASRRIRNIEAALRERGVEFEPATIQRRPPTGSASREKYTDEDLIAGLQRASDLVGHAPSANEYASLVGTLELASAITVQTRFGGWRAATLAAGLQPRQTRGREYATRWDAEACWAALERVADRIGNPPSYSRYERFAATRSDLPSGTSLRERLGPWSVIAAKLATRMAARTDSAGDAPSSLVQSQSTASENAELQRFVPQPVQGIGSGLRQLRKSGYGRMANAFRRPRP